MAAKVTYVPNIGPGSGVAELLRSNEMKRHMTEVGGQAAGIARAASPTPNEIRATPIMAFSRWCVNVENTATDALIQEYGGRGRPPVHPLARVVDELARADPNRRKPFFVRLLRR